MDYITRKMIEKRLIKTTENSFPSADFINSERKEAFSSYLLERELNSIYDLIAWGVSKDFNKVQATNLSETAYDFLLNKGYKLTPDTNDSEVTWISWSWGTLTLINILIYGGAAFTVIGALAIIRFDGSIKRVVLSGLAILIGLTGILVGSGEKKKLNMEFVITDISTEIGRITYIEKDKYKGSNLNSMDLPQGTYAYLDEDFILTLHKGDTITNGEIEQHKKN